MNLSTVNREVLVSELLEAIACAPARKAPVAPCCVRQSAAPLDAQRQKHLNRALSIARELLIRDLRRDLQDQPVMKSPQVLHDWLRIYCADLEHEVFLVIFMDAQHRLIDVESMFRGSLNETSVHPREVVKGALARNAAAVAFAHNHPGGLPTPSHSDERLTARLTQALALVDVRVLDHWIVAAGRLVSMTSLGLV